MTLLHMDTDNVGSLADYLDRAANEVVDTAHDLRRSANRLNGKWYGGRSDQFLRSLSSAANAAENVAEDATRLSRRLRAEVAEWLEADRDGAGRVLGAVTPLPMSAPTPVPTPNVGEQSSLVDTMADLVKGDRFGQAIDDVWTWTELGILFSAYGFINISAGSSYADQIIIEGPGWAKALWGLSPNLTHIKGGSMAGHLGNQSRNITLLALLSPMLKTYDQWLVALQTPHEDNLRAGTAMFVDTLVIFGTYLPLTYAGASIGSHIGGWIGGGIGTLLGGGGGTAVAPGAGTVAGGVGGIASGAAVGAMIGGVAGGIAGNYVAGLVADEYLKSDLRNEMIDSIVNLIRWPMRSSIVPET
jgi:uncharacterized protein YukE